MIFGKLYGQNAPFGDSPQRGKAWEMERYTLTILPGGMKIPAYEDQLLLKALREAGFRADAPCGGAGTCGKCLLRVDGREVLSCQTLVDGDMTVELPGEGER